MLRHSFGRIIPNITNTDSTALAIFQINIIISGCEFSYKFDIRSIL